MNCWFLVIIWSHQKYMLRWKLKIRHVKPHRIFVGTLFMYVTIFSLFLKLIQHTRAYSNEQ